MIPSFTYAATVENERYIYDGDTVTRVKVDLGFHTFVEIPIRLAGIDTPELRGDEKEAGKVSRDWLRANLPIGKPFVIRTQKTGKFGRWIADVYVDGRHLNQELIDEGLAKAVDYGD